MREVLPDVERWLEAGKRVALATVAKVYGSAPRPLGAKMAVSEKAEMAGSVSGGCVESAVVQEALEVLAEGRPRLLPFGITDEQAWEVGLACGGRIEVFVEPMTTDENRPVWEALRDALRSDRLVALATVLSGPLAGRKVLFWPDGETVGTLGDPTLEAEVRRAAAAALATQRTERLHIPTPSGETAVLLEVFPPSPKLVIVGAVHIAIPLVTMAKALGFRTIVVDARQVFATEERFGHADELRIGWPEDVLAQLPLDEGTYVVVLSHDEKLDNPALKVALQHPVRYVGALGSRKTHARRVQALRDMGLSEDQIARIHAPIGLDIGASTPEEIAVAIMAEIVAVKNGRDLRQAVPAGMSG